MRPEIELSGRERRDHYICDSKRIWVYRSELPW